MKNSLDKTERSLFEEVDAEIRENTGKDTVTYKKETVAQIVLSYLKDSGYSRVEIVGMVNGFVEHFKSALMEGSTIVITKHGRLVPRIKKGGRPVRDLSRNRQIEMKTTATATFSKTKKAMGGKVTSRGLTQSFMEQFEGDRNKQILAGYIASTFFACIARTKNENVRMEVRGLGVFRSQRINARTGRNPKTGEKTDIKEAVYPRFRISKPFRDELAEALSKIDPE
ncbi:TPA: HU family DNA-binding protein [Vibrio parahaemolyticus]